MIPPAVRRIKKQEALIAWTATTIVCLRPNDFESKYFSFSETCEEYSTHGLVACEFTTQYAPEDTDILVIEEPDEIRVAQNGLMGVKMAPFNCACLASFLFTRVSDIFKWAYGFCACQLIQFYLPPPSGSCDKP